MDDTNQLLREILEAITTGGSVFNSSTVDEATKNLMDMSDSIKLANSSAEELRNQSRQLYQAQKAREAEIQKALKSKLIDEKQAREELQKFVKAQRQLQLAMAGLGEDAVEFDEEILEATENLEKHTESLKTNKEQVDLLNQKTDKLGKKFNEINRNFLQPFFTTGIGLLKGLQGNSGYLQVAGQAAEGLASATTSAASGLGGMITDAGSGLMGLGGRAKNAGAALFGLGKIVGITANAVGAVAKEALPYLNVELEKSENLFQTANAAGALYVDGMTGMRNAAHNAGLTIDQFGEVLKTQSSNFSNLGVGVSGATKYLGNVASTLQKSGMQREMLNLGYGFREQAELVGETVSLMRLAQGGASKIPTDVVAKETTKYAENLRLISAITGEDAKTKMQQAKDAANNLAFQQKLSQMAPEQQSQILRAMATMTEIERKNYMDMMLFGAIINSEGAKSAALFPVLQEKVNRQIALTNQGMLDAESNAKLNATLSQKTRNQIQNQTAIGLAAYAGAGSVTEVAKNALESLDQSIKYTTDSVKAAADAVKDQKTTQDELTDSMKNLETSVQTVRQAIESTLTPTAIKGYADILDQGLAVIKDAIVKFTNWVKTGDTDQTKVIEPMTVGEKAAGSAGAAGLAALGAGVMTKGTLAAKGVAAAGAGLAAGIGLAAGAGIDEIAGVAGIGKEKLTEQDLRKDSENFSRMSLTEKAISSIGRTIEVVGDYLFLDNMVRQARLERIRSESEYLDKKQSGKNEPLKVQVEESRAKGGIAQGPKSGYLAQLHGTEAVVPLPDGKTIPVNIPDINNIIQTVSNVDQTSSMMRTLMSGFEKVTPYDNSHDMVSGLREIKESIEKSLVSRTDSTLTFSKSQKSNAELLEALGIHAELMRQQMRRIDELIRIAEDQRDLTRNILQVQS